MTSPLSALLARPWAALGGGPAVHARWWPAELRAAFPGRRRLREAWTGEGAAFARYSSVHGALFLKYLPPGLGARAYGRLRREAAYLRDLAPLSPVPHAPLRHWALDEDRERAHLLTRDLTDETYGWGHFGTDPEREAALVQVVQLLARHHAFWSGPAGLGHPALRGEWAWAPDAVLARAARMERDAVRFGPHSAIVREVAKRLPDLLGRAETVTLAHGDLHSGQVLWPRSGDSPVLIDYGQVHPSVVGEDLAHLLYVRLDAPERERLGPALRGAYREELAAHGLRLSPQALAHEERAGLALNLLSTVRQAQRGESSGVLGALERVTQAWREV